MRPWTRLGALHSPWRADKIQPTLPSILHSNLAVLVFAAIIMSIRKDGEMHVNRTSGDQNAESQDEEHSDRPRQGFKLIYTWICIVLLFANYFLAQYDKFILSYFQGPLSSTLHL